ncbi:uncharacterized protein N7483_008198 [Penicillium malachiteum]|uniref:uncharacterized protein n=1 Tax=Penicillium malachiteum TaxID=1324776 RepID=UPI00254727FA|nr:uncharacterized protein N7483_008198 [Penicillium malachiteum]KAJ5720264.1 hypothetical protein N7483_008198 [Penicillium malachiteum]
MLLTRFTIAISKPPRQADGNRPVGHMRRLVRLSRPVGAFALKTGNASNTGENQLTGLFCVPSV